MSPTPHPSPEHLETLMAGYVLNTLSPAETEEFEQYLEADPHLRQRMQQWQEVMGLLAYLAPPTTAPANLKAKILESASPVALVKPLPSVRKFRWKPVMDLVAAILLVAMGIHTYQMDRKLRFLESTLTSLQGKETYVFAMRGHETAKDASGSVVLDLEAGQAIVALQKLPPLPAGEVYALWARTRDRQIFCGQFNPTEGQVVAQLAISKETYTSSTQSMQIFRTAAATPTQQDPNRLVMVSESEAEEHSEEQ